MIVDIEVLKLGLGWRHEVELEEGAQESLCVVSKYLQVVGDKSIHPKAEVFTLGKTKKVKFIIKTL